MNRIEFAEPKRELQALGEVAEEHVLRVLRSGHYILGHEVERFEQELALFVPMKHVVSVSSGTDALICALRALDLGPGDEVLVPAFSFIATAEAILRVGAKPIFCDVNLDDALINVASIEQQKTDRCRAILAVDLYGRCPNMPWLKQFDLPIIEDAAQALGALDACTQSDIACTSFFPSKPLGAAGDGGACITNHEPLATRLRALRQHGQTARHEYQYVGGNHRLDAIQAAILRAKLPFLAQRNARRIKIAKQIISNLGLLQNQPMLPFVAIRVHNRQAAQTLLDNHAIAYEMHYPYRLPDLPMFSKDIFNDVWPNAKRWSREVLAIPCHAELFDEEVERLCYVAKALQPLIIHD